MSESLMEEVQDGLDAADAEVEFIPDSDTPLTKQYAALELERRDLESKLKTVKEKARAAEKLLLDEFAATGVSSCRVTVDAGELTLYLKKEYHVTKRSEVSTDALCGLLREAGLGYLVSDGYNAASLKAALVERKAKGGEIPDSLASALNQVEMYRVATRK